MPFDDDYSENLDKVKQIGLNNDKSMFKPKENNFENKVKELEAGRQKYTQDISKASINFKKILEDKTLKQNKGPLAEKIEADVVKDLTDLARKINSDETQEEGIGSMLLSSLLLKIAILERDRANLLEFRIKELEKKIEDFPNLIETRLNRLNGNKLDK